ncbi:MAG: alanine racemase [Pseudomonadota bacterium]
MSTLSRALIDLNALQQNIIYLKQHASTAKVWAVVKANAYGHSVELCVKSLLNHADGFAVAHWEEALEIQHILETQSLSSFPPILLLEGINSDNHYRQLKHVPSARLVIHSISQIKSLISLAPKIPIYIWLKFDSGMHRLGLNEKELIEILNQLNSYDHISVEGILSHFACAEEPQHDLTQQQLKAVNHLKTIVQPKNPLMQWSLCNSAGIIHQLSKSALNQTQDLTASSEWIRPGIALYGSFPIDKAGTMLKPVMSFTTKILSTKKLSVGDTVGYGATFTASSNMSIAILGVGYADGYPRILSNQGEVWCQGYKLPVVGRISMDLTCVALPNLNILGPDYFTAGNEVELWGKNINVDEVALVAKTISYELLTGVGSRVPRIKNNIS